MNINRERAAWFVATVLAAAIISALLSALVAAITEFGFLRVFSLFGSLGSIIGLAIAVMQFNSDPNEWPIYNTLEEFEDELYEIPEYVPPRYEISGWGDLPQVPKRESGDSKGSASAEDEPPDVDDRADGSQVRNREPTKGRAGRNAKEKMMELIDRDKPSVTLVTGESGIGKTRLLVEVGRALADRTDVEAWYARGRGEVREPPAYEDNTVLFLDGVGRMDDPEQFFRFASPGHRERGTNSTVHVVASVRPVYLDELRERSIPGSVDRRVIELRTLDEDGSLELLSSTEVSTETARSIHAATDGNPFLSWLLAEGGRTDGAAVGPQEKIREIIDETIEEAGVLQSDADSARQLLRAISILGEYDVADEAEQKAVIEFCDGPRGGQHDEALSELSDTNYIRSVERTDSADGTVFAHKYDVFAEYLRLDTLGKEGRQYKRFVSQCPASSLGKVAEGLVELRESTLERLEFFKKEDVRAETRKQLATAASTIIDADTPLEDIFAFQTSVARVAPDVIPHSDLERRFENSTPGVAVAERMAEFVSILYRQGSEKIEPEGSSCAEDATIDDSNILGSARKWLVLLNELAEINPDDEDIQLQLAWVLRMAAYYESESRRFKTAQNLLDRLEQLAGFHPNHADIHLEVARALLYAVHHESEAGRFRTVQDRLDRLDQLAGIHPNHADIHLEVARALLDAVIHEGKAGRFKTVQDRLDRLKQLAENHRNDADIHLEVAKAFVNAALYEGEAGRFKTVQDRLDRLEDLAAAHPNHADIQLQLATALLNAVIYESEAGRFKTVQDRLDRLKQLAELNFDDNNIQQNLVSAYLVYIRWLAEQEEYEAVNKAVAALDESSSSLGRVSFHDEVNNDYYLQRTASNLLRAKKVPTLERLLTVLRTRGDGQHADSICAEVMTEADQLLDSEEISPETYERVELMCAGK